MPVRWSVSNINIALSSSLSNPPANFRGGSDLRGAAIRALGRWSAVTNINFNITDTELISVNSNDAVNLITVANTTPNNNLFAGGNNGLLGRAAVNYNSTSGFVTDGDIALNALNPQIEFSTDGAFNTYDAEEEFTHEIGHLLGLDHSAITGAVMRPYTVINNSVFSQGNAGRTLSTDDVIGVQTLYGQRTSTPKGEVSGVVTNESGSAVVGAHVWVEAATGKLAGSNISLANGEYRIANIAPGNYRMFIEPLNEPVSTIDVFYVPTNAPSFTSFEVTAGSNSLSSSSSRRSLPRSPRGVRSSGGINVTANTVTRRDIRVNTATPPSFNIQAVGVQSGGGIVSFAGVPFAPGETKTFLIEGANLTNLLPGTGGSIVATSPFISIQNVAFNSTDSRGLPIIQMTLRVAGNTPNGEYSLLARNANGEAAFLSGGIMVEAATSANALQTNEDVSLLKLATLNVNAFSVLNINTEGSNNMRQTSCVERHAS